jgi:hypothetical protein
VPVVRALLQAQRLANVHQVQNVLLEARADKKRKRRKQREKKKTKWVREKKMRKKRKMKRIGKPFQFTTDKSFWYTHPSTLKV